MQKRKNKLASWSTVSIQPPQSTKWRSVQTRQKWWQTTQMASKTNSKEGSINDQRLEEVENFKCLEAIISNEGSKPEILSRIAQTTAALPRLKTIWRSKNISLASKVKLMRTLILSNFLYACESWTLTTEIERRIHALEMRCYRRLLNISYKDRVTNKEVRNRIQNATGVYDDLLTMVKKRKLRRYGHIWRSSGMAKTILQGTVKGARRRGRRDGKITSRNGVWRFPESKRKTGKGGNVLLQRHLWSPDDLRGYGTEMRERWGYANLQKENLKMPPLFATKWLDTLKNDNRCILGSE